MREIDKNLTAGKSTKNTQNRKGKNFGYQILGFGSGGGGPICITYDFFIVSGGGGGVNGYGGGGGGGGVHFSYGAPGTAGITKNDACGNISIQVGAGGSGNSGPGGGNSPYAAGDGGTSIAFKCEPTAVTVKGGGGADTRHNNGRAAPTPGGGSGGGGGCFHLSGTSGGAGSCYGNPGSGAATYTDNPSRFRSGSGGGACTAATAGGAGGNGAAGCGKASDIEGSTKNFGCGGVGSGVSNCLNGRGDGGNPSQPTANQGGGGGRASPAAGADGVVYLRFPTACKPANMGVTPSCNSIITTGSCTVLKFVVSGCVTFT